MKRFLSIILAITMILSLFQHVEQQKVRIVLKTSKEGVTVSEQAEPNDNDAEEKLPVRSQHHPMLEGR